MYMSLLVLNVVFFGLKNPPRLVQLVENSNEGADHTI